MKTHLPARCVQIAAAAVSLGAGFASFPAYAVLGGAPSYAGTASSASGQSIVNRQVTQRAAAAATYSVHEATLTSGTVIREYVGANGAVFGIAWQGPQMPDLQTLLGSYFPQYVGQLDAQRAKVGGHGPVRVTGTGLTVHSGGHMGAFAGQAYLPQALPTGVSPADIR
jgi:hypothetical protein